MDRKIIFLTVVLIFAAGSIAFTLLHTGPSLAFNGPSNSAGLGSGSLSVDSSGNFSVGTTTLPGNARLSVVGTTTDANYFSFRAMDKAGSPLFVVRNDGKVGIGIALFPATSTFRVAGAIESTSGGFIFPDGSIQLLAVVSTDATSTSAGYVTPGTFNSVANTGGAYTFPATLAASTTLAVGTTTMPSGLSLFSNGPVGILNNAKIGSGLGWGCSACGASSTINLYDGGNGAMLFSAGFSGSYFDFSKTGASRLRIDTNGNIGIGTTTPAYPLTVNGQMSVLGNRILNVAAPIASSDAATKGYVDGLAGGLYNGKLATCTTAGCTATATCDNGTVISWVVVAYNQGANTNECEVTSVGTNAVQYKASCIGQSSCAVIENNTANQACAFAICAR